MRALAREVAFKKIYESLFTSNPNDIDLFFEQDNITKKEDKDFVLELLDLYNEHKQEIENTINSFLVDYAPERVFKIDRAIISLAVTEMKYYNSTPDSVVINEAVNLAKKYGTDKSYSFVNGILKSIKEGK